jgi:uncharacterized protein YoxC
MVTTAINMAATITSDPEAMATLGLVADFLPAILIGLIAWFLKKTLKDFEKKVNENTKKIESNDTKLVAKINEVEKDLIKKIDCVKDDVSDYKEQAQKDFVSKDDYTQAISDMLKKQDRIMEYIIELTKKVSGKGD